MEEEQESGGVVVKLGKVSILEELPTSSQLRFGAPRAGRGCARAVAGGC